MNNEESFIAFMRFLDNKKEFKSRFDRLQALKKETEETLVRFRSEEGKSIVREEELQKNISKYEILESKVLSKERSLEQLQKSLKEERSNLDEEKKELSKDKYEFSTKEKDQNLKEKELYTLKSSLENMQESLRNREEDILEKENKLKSYFNK